MLLPTVPSDASASVRIFLRSLMQAVNAEIEGLKSQVRNLPVVPPPFLQDDPMTRVYAVTFAANTVLNPGEVNCFVFANCTSASNLTLPTPYRGMWVFIANNGTATITLKDDLAGTIEAIPKGGFVSIRAVEGSSGTMAWMTGTLVSFPGGVALTTSDWYWDSTTAGPLLKDTNGHYWRITISTLGAITTTDVGTSLPTESIGP